MSFFRDFADQTRQGFLAMPVQSRVIAVLLVVAIAVSLGFLVKGGSPQETVFLLGDQVLSEKELTAMDIAFGQTNLSGWHREGRRMRVPAKNRSEFLAALKESTILPSGLQSHVEKAFATMSPFESSEIIKARLMLGEEQDVAKALEAMPYVRAATVSFTRSERRAFQPERPMSAAVMITPEGTAPLDKSQLRQIQMHVAKSFGMSEADVNVTDVNSSGSSLLVDDEDPLLRRKREVEEHTKRQILNQLAYIEGVRVDVSAEIDPILDSEQTTVEYDEQPTTISEKSRKIKRDSNRPGVGGVPGTETNAIGNRARSLEELADTTSLSDDIKESNKIVGQTYQQSRTAGLIPKKVTATISLPTSYYDKLWLENKRREDPQTPPDQLPQAQSSDIDELRSKTVKKIQDIVTPLLPDVAAGEDARPLVRVEDFPDLRVATVEESETTERALSWLAHSWKSIGLLLLGVFALLVARSAVRGGDGNTPPEYAEGFGLDLPVPPAPVEGEAEPVDKMTITGGSLQSELTLLVEANPEVAANVIRGWVGEAA